jgi:hypothetical protein
MPNQKVEQENRKMVKYSVELVTGINGIINGTSENNIHA